MHKTRQRGEGWLKITNNGPGKVVEKVLQSRPRCMFVHDP